MGRSGSSGSSTGASEAGAARKRTASQGGKSFNSSLSSLSVESLDNTGQEEEDLLADCISSAMPKSKSEHFDLAAKSKKSKKSPAREKPGASLLLREKSAPSLREKSPGAAREGAGSVLRRERSGSNLRRSSSKSPRGSRLVPGVVIPELKLLPRSKSQEMRLLPRSRPHSQEVKEIMEEKYLPVKQEERLKEEIEEPEEEQVDAPVQSVWDKPSVDTSCPFLEGAGGAGGNQVESGGSLAGSGGSGGPLGLCSLTQSGLTEAGLVARALSLSTYSEAPSLISDTGPPSLMQDSLPSLSMAACPPRRPSLHSDAALQCRHTISSKLGSSVPLAVRRALGGREGLSIEDLSSLSSCHSNLDAIQPPTLLEDLDMDSSLMSVASLNSDMAALAMAGSGSTDSASASLTSEAIRAVVGPCGAEVRDFQESSMISAPHLTMSGMSQGLDKVEPPSNMEELTVTANSCTLVADLPGGTFLVQQAEDNNDTIADVPADALDDEETVNEPTLTGGSEGVLGEDMVEAIPDLPRDSRGGTPAQSGGESSAENTPEARRKLSPKEKRQVDRERFRTITKPEEEHEEQEGMEQTLTQSRAMMLDDQTSFRQTARGLDDERFRTRTITREDLSCPSSPEKNPSPSSRRGRDARFLTQTIGPGDLVRREEEEESLPAVFLAEEALRVVASLTEGTARSRSQSAEILGESEMRDSREDLLRSRDQSRDLLARDESLEKVVSRPRVCKPWETRVQVVKMLGNFPHCPSSIAGNFGHNRPKPTGPYDPCQSAAVCLCLQPTAQ